MRKESSKYKAIIVDSAPDSSHAEQTTFLLRYLVRHDSRFAIEERFLIFVNRSDKAGSDIAPMTTETLESHSVPLADCKAQGYNNEANMSGKWNGAQAIINEQFIAAISNPCRCHKPNLCGIDAAACISEAITYIGTMQAIFTLFSCGPKRWKILTKQIGCSLHDISGTRWSDRAESVKQLVAQVPRVKMAFEDLLELKLTPKARNEILGAICDVSSITYVIMPVVSYSILGPIDFCNNVIQASNATLDMKFENIESLLAQLVALRDSWKAAWNEAKLVVSCLQIEVKLRRDRSTTARKRTRLNDEDTLDENVNEMNEADESPEESHFRKHIFYVVFDDVIGGPTARFSAVRLIYDTFSLLWKYQKMSPDELKRKAAKLAAKYSEDIISEDLVLQMNHITCSQCQFL